VFPFIIIVVIATSFGEIKMCKTSTQTLLTITSAGEYSSQSD